MVAISSGFRYDIELKSNIKEAKRMSNINKDQESLKKIARKHKPVKKYLRTFLEKYEEVFEPIRNEPLKILEIGVGGYKDEHRGGGSLRMWSEYFPNSTIIGVDINYKDLELPENVVFRQGSQTDKEFLIDLSEEYEGFDIVIDDAAHITPLTIETFDILYDLTSKYYIIEDLHMKKAEGTKEYFAQMSNSDLATDHICVISK